MPNSGTPYKGLIIPDIHGKEWITGGSWGIYLKLSYGKVVYHTGGWPGYLTCISRYIESDKTIIILFNHFIPLQRGLPKSIEKILHYERLSFPKK